MKIKSALWTGLHVVQRLIVAFDTCLGWNDTCIMRCSLSKLASDKSKNVILDWIADLSCAQTSIIGQDKPSSTSCSVAVNTQRVSQSPTRGDVDLMCARTSMILLHKPRL